MAHMRKYIYNAVIIVFVLQMSHVQVFANYEHKKMATANSIETLQNLIQYEVMQLSTNFDIRYSGDTSNIKDELSDLIKQAIQDPYIYANISSFKWKYDGYANNIVISFEFTYHITPAEEAFVEQTLKNIIAPMYGLTELQKLQAAHDFIVLSAEYSKETTGSQYSPYTLLTENKGVCQAYALVLYRMLEMLDFEVQYVPGNVGEQLHAWVLVKLENDWYHIDVTWDDPLPDRKGEVRYQYFLVSDRQLAKDHSWDYASFPAAKSEAYVDLQRTNKVEELPRQILNNGFSLNKGKIVIDNNQNHLKSLLVKPTKLKMTKENEETVQVLLQDVGLSIIIDDSILQMKNWQKKTYEAINTTESWLTSIDRIEKRMPQEKYVILKEVSHKILGAPPSSFIFLYLELFLMFVYFYSSV